MPTPLTPTATGGIAARHGVGVRRASWWAMLLVVVAATGALGSCGGGSEPAAAPATDAPVTTPATGATTTRPPTTLGTDGSRIYAAKCAACHGRSGEGDLAPTLVGIADRMTSADQRAIVTGGRGTMPAFAPALSDEQIDAVVAYTRTALG